MSTTTVRITKKAARAELARRKLDHDSPEFAENRPKGKQAILVQKKGWELREIIATPVRRKASV
jgi:hypothetical protein